MEVLKHLNGFIQEFLSSDLAYLSALSFLAVSLVAHRLSKSLQKHKDSLNRDLESHKAALKLKSDEKIARLKDELGQASSLRKVEHQIKQSGIYEKQSEVSLKLPRLTKNLEDAAFKVPKSSSPTYKEGLKDLMENVSALSKFSSVNEILIDEYVRYLIEELIAFSIMAASTGKPINERFGSDCPYLRVVAKRGDILDQLRGTVGSSTINESS